MKSRDIKVGGLYLAKISGKIVTVRVDMIREAKLARNAGTETVYDITNLNTGKKTTFRSAAKFRCEAPPDVEKKPSIKITVGDLTPEDANTLVQAVNDGKLSDIGAVEAKLLDGGHGSDPTGLPTVIGTGIAARIASSRAGRKPGTPVAGMTPNQEQESILAVASEIGNTPVSNRALVVGAGAGTGKTATLKMLEQVLPGRGQYTAFNASLVDESKEKFQKCPCNTTHSLAFRAVGKQYQHRLNRERMRSSQVAGILGIHGMTLSLKGMGPPNLEGKPTDLTKRLSAEFLAGQVLMAVKRFCMSDDREITERHLRYIDGIDRSRQSRENNEKVRNYLLPFCKAAWVDMVDTQGQLPFTHDCYVKIWQLGEGHQRPVIAADYILLDEAQDTAPVFLDVLKQQSHALLVLVGDDNQQIYEWRGAVNAMGAFPGAPRRLLSQSYRFGQAVADVANTVLAGLKEKTDLIMRGNPDIPSRVCKVENPHCYLYRTNAGAVGRVMLAISQELKPHLIGGGADTVAWCQAALDLQEKRGTRHPELCCFETWEEVKEYSKTDEGGDLRLMVKLVNDFGAQLIRDGLRDMPSEEDADLVVSTAHKSKGREWQSVKLGSDFPTTDRMNDPDIRLLYVALTRARLNLDISECPPFCGTEVYIHGEGKMFVPGMRIRYTQPMPSAEQQTQWLESKVISHLDEIESEVIKNDPVAYSDQAQGVVDIIASIPKAIGYSWCKWGDRWAVRGPAETPLGTTVQVSRMDGTTKPAKIVRVLHRYVDSWIYAV